MTFGFWCAFFHRKYDPIIWHRKHALKTLCPNLPRVNRKRSYIEKQLLKIKDLRNRIAHHEPIINNHYDINEIHSLCHKLIKAFSADAFSFLQSIDNFPKVYKKHKSLIQN